MKSNKLIGNKILSLILSLSLIISSININVEKNNVKADMGEGYLGTLADKVTGTWITDDGRTETNAMLLNKLPTIANKGTYRWTTDNYDESVGAFENGGWSTSMAWNFSSNAFGNSTFIICCKKYWYVCYESINKGT